MKVGFSRKLLSSKMQLMQHVEIIRESIQCHKFLLQKYSLKIVYKKRMQ